MAAHEYIGKGSSGAVKIIQKIPPLDYEVCALFLERQKSQ
jgi:hypothetical protein